MDDKKETLIRAVKLAVARYGISGTSTRNISEIAKVNDAYIYRFFTDKDDLLFQAYQHENGAIFDAIQREIEASRGMHVPFEERARTVLDRIWDYFLSDYNRIIFCVAYFHSAFFSSAGEYHQKQLDVLNDAVGRFFPRREDCEHAMNSLCTIMYDAAYGIVTGRVKNTQENKDRVFKTEMVILKSHMKENIID